MKNGITWLLFLVHLFLINFKSNAQIYNDCSLITKETQIIDYGDISMHNNIYSFDIDDLNFGLENFYNHFEYCIDRENENMLRFENHIERLTLEDLRSLATLITADNQYSNDRCIAGIRLHYGIEYHKMVLLIEPIILAPEINNENYNFRIKKLNTINYWRIKNNVLVIENDSTLLIRNYQSQDPDVSKVYITHPRISNAQTTWFIDNSDAYIGDSKSCILPIQQITKMYCDNDGFGGYINLSIVANKNYKYQFWPNLHLKNFKLHVVAYMDNIGKNDFHNSFLYLGADFGQMDPPHKESVYYPLK